MKLKFTFAVALLFIVSGLIAQQYTLPPEAAAATEIYVAGQKYSMQNAVFAGTRNDCENLRDSVIFRNFQEGESVIDYREIFTYDEQYRRTSQTIEQNLPNFGGLTMTREVLSEYSEGQRIDMTSTLDFGTGEFGLLSRSTVTLNPDGMPLVNETEDYDAGTDTFTKRLRRTYTYENNSTAQILYEDYDTDSDAYILSGRDIYIYTADDLILEILRENYDPATEEWTYSRNFLWEYDAMNRISSFTWKRLGVDDAIVTIFRDEYLYNSDNDNIEVLEYRNFDSTPEGLILSGRVLNVVENGLNVTDSLYTYPPDMSPEFMLTGHFDNFYDTEDRLVLAREFDTEDNLVSERETFFRECISSAENIAVQNTACDFPNPLTAGQVLSCDFADNRPAVVRLYDLTGKTVLTAKMNGDGRFYFKNLPHDGAYILTVESEANLLYREKVIIVGGR